MARGANRNARGVQQHGNRAAVEWLQVVHEHAAADDKDDGHGGRRHREAGGRALGGAALRASAGAGVKVTGGATCMRVLCGVRGDRHVQPEDAAVTCGPQRSAWGAGEVPQVCTPDWRSIRRSSNY